MKQFFKIFFASMLGFIIGLVVLVFILFGVLAAMVSSFDKKTVTVKDNSILHVYFNQPLSERSDKNPFKNLDFNTMKAKQQPGLNDIVAGIKKAAIDPKIEGIYLDVVNLQGGMAQVEEIRNALIQFKKSGKYIYAYAESYSQKAYYLSSVSDKIYLNPQGIIELHGLQTELMFFKGTLDKLEVQPQLIRHGKYKSAGETFVLDKMSDDNRIQIAAMVNSIWDHLKNQIAVARKITPEEVEEIADSLKIRSANDAVTLGLADKIAYYDEFVSDLNKKIGSKPEKTELELISLNQYKRAPDASKEKFTTDRVAVIYATGEINSGDGDDETIGADALSAAIRKARTDKNVKAIVLRVNSPGGSALASEIIWRETMLAAKAKPFVVSMSNLAASGGYYISCGAHKIVSQPTTLTGSIGVFGLLLNAQNMLKNKLGITTDGYKTSPYTDLGSVTRPITKSEELIVQHQVDQIYNTFTKRVSEGRNITTARVDELGQGRIWSGTDALQNSLVDTLGGLQDAIAIAARLAKMSNYRIKELPEQKEPLEELMTDLSAEAKAYVMEEELGEQAKYLQTLKNLLRTTGIQAKMMMEVSW